MTALKVSGPFTFSTPPSTLASVIGQIPASLNMFLYCGTSDGRTQYGSMFTDFISSNPGGAAIPFTRTGIASVTGYVASYDSSLTASVITEDTSNGNHKLGTSDGQISTSTVMNNTPLQWRFMTIAKANGRNRIVAHWSSNDANSDVTAGFNLSTGQTGYSNTTGANTTITGTSMVNLGGGWWACLLDFTFNSTTNSQIVMGPNVLLDNGSGTAAQSTSYSGDGVSGIKIALWHCLPKVMWTHSWTNVFLDDHTSLSSIDLANAKPASGVNWYIDTFNFPNSTPANFWGAVTPNPPVVLTPTNPFQQYDSTTLRIQRTGTPPGVGRLDWATSLMTVAYKSGTGLGSLVGKTFAGPLVFDVFMRVGTSPNIGAGTNSSNTSWWHTAAETLAGATDVGGDYIELDTNESAVGNNSSFTSGGDLISWNKSSGGTQVASFTLNNGIRGWQDTWTRWTQCWFPIGSADDPNWGFYIGFYNGNVTVGNGGVCYNTIIPRNASFAVGDAQHQTIIIWGATCDSPGGIAPPVDLDWSSVWQ